jgi:L-cysteine desulfidase
LYGHYEAGLEVIKDLDTFDAVKVEALASDHCTIDIRWDLPAMGVYIEVIAKTTNGMGHAIVAQGHDRIVLLEANGKMLFVDENYSETDSGFEKKRAIREYGLKDLYDFSREVDIASLGFLKEALEKNRALAELGLENASGAGIGAGFQKMLGQSYITRAKYLAAAASDARMAGETMPAMSCAGSGNVGITASVPLISVAEEKRKSEEDLLRALALSYLVTIMAKAHIGRLSPVCACAMAASLGIGCGTCLMLGGTFEQLEYTVANIIGSTGGILCDGAKFGCALKLGSAAGSAIESALLALENVRIPCGDGLVDFSGDRTLALLGEIASEGMLSVDEYMARKFIDREAMDK